MRMNCVFQASYIMMFHVPKHYSNRYQIELTYWLKPWDRLHYIIDFIKCLHKMWLLLAHSVSTIHKRRRNICLYHHLTNIMFNCCTQGHWKLRIVHLFTNGPQDSIENVIDIHWFIVTALTTHLSTILWNCS